MGGNVRVSPRKCRMWSIRVEGRRVRVSGNGAGLGLRGERLYQTIKIDETD